jgi:hypothetical protein
MRMHETEINYPIYLDQQLYTINSVGVPGILDHQVTPVHLRCQGLTIDHSYCNLKALLWALTDNEH